MSVSRLLEELVPFMDHSIDDPAAMRMSGGHHKRKQPSSKVCCQYADRLVLSMHIFLPRARPCHISRTACGVFLVGARCPLHAALDASGARKNKLPSFWLQLRLPSISVRLSAVCSLPAGTSGSVHDRG